MSVPHGTSETPCLIQAIDPGTEKSAIVELRLPEWTVVRHEILPNEELIASLWKQHCHDGAEGYRVAIEMIACYGMRVGSEVFETCVWIGRFIQVIGSTVWQTPVTRIFRREVKLELCNSARANDADVRAALIDIWGPGKAKAIGLKATPGPLYGVHDDEWQALGVAVTYARRLEGEG